MAQEFARISSEFLASIDAEIERLQTLREQVAAAVNAEQAATKTGNTIRRRMSEEGRRKIAAAQKARWAKQRRANAATKAPASKPASKSIAKKPVKKRASNKSLAKKAAAFKIAEPM